MKKCLVVMTILALVAVLAVGCTGATSPMPTPTSPTPAPAPTLPAGMGTLEVRVTDAPPEYGTIEEIWITVVNSEEEGIAVHKAVAEQEQQGEGDQNQVQNQVQQGEGEWITIPITGDNPFELLSLQKEDLDALLGEADVPDGKYTQIRMTIEKVEIYFEGETEPIEAELPSGKLKFVRPFNVVDGETTIILLDFIADKSVTVTGKGDVIFKPVIKLSIQQASKPHELISVEGTISAVDTDENNSTVSIIPEGGSEDDTIVLSVNPQTEITLDGEEATLEDLDELGEGNSVTASYYLNNLKATQIDAWSP